MSKEDTIHRCEVHCVEHWEEPELKCPYCLYVETDSWEIARGEGDESGTTECSVCDREYDYGGVDSVTYTTYQIESDEAKS